MELRKGKRIYNQLPKYDEGKPLNSYFVSNDAQFRELPTVGSGLSTQTLATMNQQIGKERAEAAANTPGNRALNSMGSIATNAINFTGSIINANTLGRSTGEIMADAGSRYVNTGEFSWQRQNEINGAQEMSDLHKQHVSNTLSTMGTGAALGASIGSIFPGAGTAIGAVGGAIVGGIAGLLGGGKTHAQMRKRIYNAQQQRLRNNNFNFASAQGEWLNQQYDLNHAYTQDGQIYVAKYGKACGGLMKRK